MGQAKEETMMTRRSFAPVLGVLRDLSINDSARALQPIYLCLERSGEAGWEKHRDRNEKELLFLDRRNGEIVM